MTKITIKDWVILLALAPTFLIGSILGLYFTVNSVLELDDSIKAQVTSIAGPMGLVSANYLSKSEYSELKDLFTYRQSNNPKFVKSMLLYNHNNQLLINTNSGTINTDYALHVNNLPLTKEFNVQLPDRFIHYIPLYYDVPNRDKTSIENKYFGYIIFEINEEDINEEKRTMFIIMFTLLVFAMMITSYFSSKLIDIISMPIREMNDIVLQIRQGVLDTRLDVKFHGELEILRLGINNMAQAIEDYQIDLESNVDEATHDLREALEQFEVQNVQLDLAKRKAQDANKVKSEFLANMSHELRTPLNGVIGFTRQILKTRLTEIQREYLNTIDNSANNLLTIINDILDFSKLDSGRMVIESIPFGFRNSIDEAITLLSTSANSKNLELILDIKHSLPNSLIGDALRVKQVIMNLLGNAIKFTEEGYISINVDYEMLNTSDIKITIKVTDTGIGINEQQQTKLFQAFSQADKSITRLYGGTGLGLVIAKRLANEMEGDITFTSVSREGTCFEFSFVSKVNQLPVDNIAEPFELEGKNILYYEAHPLSQAATASILDHWNMNVTIVSNLTELTQQLNAKNYDYALIGQKVSPTNINDIKSLIESLSERIHKVILAINNNSLSLKETFMASGAHTCIIKPITTRSLLDAILFQEQPTTISIEKRLTQPKDSLPIKVLIVDDNEANLKLLYSLLVHKVDSVSQAKDGREAFNLCNNECFDLILMDIQMPVMDGVTALEKIKDNSLNINTSIVAVTAHALPGEKENLISQGFTAYISKPIDETLLEHILYEHSGVDKIKTVNEVSNNHHQRASIQSIFDWQLALQRSANNKDLALEMLNMLIESLPETIAALQNNIHNEDVTSLSSLIHKLNGACCYLGLPKLERIINHIETQIKMQTTLKELEPELFELLDEIEQVMDNVEQFKASIDR